VSRADESDARDRTLAPSPRRDRWSTIERDLRRSVGPLIAGIDEVGRGPLAGPVVACAVIMPPDERAIRGVDDSKQLTADAREKLAAKIRERALAIGVGAASVREIDRVNIFHAAVLAMRRALGRLAIRPDHVILDGRAIRSLGTPHTAVVAGDACCYSIACASIIAKVTRDRVMHALAVRYPGYRWERNVGYSTAAHFAGIAERGVTPHHRHSFLPVRQLALPFDVPASNADDVTIDRTGELPCLTMDRSMADATDQTSSPPVRDQ
jgi:ribonuclease HII